MCYAVPLVGAVITTVVWCKKRDTSLLWLNLMLYGGTLCGVVDHLWNGELLSLPQHIGRDIVLGVVIIGTIVAVWLVICLFLLNKNKRLSPLRIKKVFDGNLPK